MHSVRCIQLSLQRNHPSPVVACNSYPSCTLTVVMKFPNNLQVQLRVLTRLMPAAINPGSNAHRDVQTSWAAREA